MEKPSISSKIFLDGANAEESKRAKELLGFLDGQTTNPSLLVKSPKIQEKAKKGKITEEELYSLYKETIKEIVQYTSGSISVEVYADKETMAKEMIKSAREMVLWTENVCIKLPITKEGLKAANTLVRENISVNMTLCFSQEQAAAVYAATKGATKPVFVSPFIGRLDDRKENGMDLIKNILKMYEKGDGHVLTLAASVRSLSHFLYSISLLCPAITSPLNILKEWADGGFLIPKEDFVCDSAGLRSIAYKEVSLESDFNNYNISHELTDIGLGKFVADWKSLWI